MVANYSVYEKTDFLYELFTLLTCSFSVRNPEFVHTKNIKKVKL